MDTRTDTRTNTLTHTWMQPELNVPLLDGGQQS